VHQNVVSSVEYGELRQKYREVLVELKEMREMREMREVSREQRSGLI
jgi:hypothetical protein